MTLMPASTSSMTLMRRSLAFICSCAAFLLFIADHALMGRSATMTTKPANTDEPSVW